MKKGKFAEKLAEIAEFENNPIVEPPHRLLRKPKAYEEPKGKKPEVTPNPLGEEVGEIFASFNDQTQTILEQRNCRSSNAVPSTATDSSLAKPLPDSKLVKQALGTNGFKYGRR